MLKVTYIFHSSFLVTTERCNVLFDFWKDPYGKLPELIDAEKPLYVVVSHFHKDHFNSEIFKFASLYPRIHYILSRDTAKRSKFFFSSTSTHTGPHLDPSLLSVLTPGESYVDNVLRIDAFGSTDVGNSYLLTTEGKRVFHAGDLNAWIWKDESTKEEVEQAITLFMKELDNLKETLNKDILDEEKSNNAVLPPQIDVSLFPVDSRLGTDYWEGAKLFLQTFRISTFIPMHYGLGSPEEQLKRRVDAAQFENYANPEYPTEYIGPLDIYGSVLKI